MQLKEFINTDRLYNQAANEIKEWVVQSYKGLSIEFDPHLEIVQTDPKRKFTKLRVQKIVEAVNIKIGDIMEKYAEQIYIAERLDRIYLNHPEFSLDVNSIDDIKTNPQFLKYLSELNIRE